MSIRFSWEMWGHATPLYQPPNEACPSLPNTCAAPPPTFPTQIISHLLLELPKLHNISPDSVTRGAVQLYNNRPLFACCLLSSLPRSKLRDSLRVWSARHTELQCVNIFVDWVRALDCTHTDDFHTVTSGNLYENNEEGFVNSRIQLETLKITRIKDHIPYILP